jgi:hypothetical protein
VDASDEKLGVGMKKKHDDWDVKVIGADEDKPKVEPTKKKSLKDLVAYLHDRTSGMSMSLNAPINGPAMMKIFSSMIAESVTHEQIYQMIDLFADDIKRIPLKEQETPWRAFAARRGELFKRVQGSTVQTTSEPMKFDPRLEKYLED